MCAFLQCSTNVSLLASFSCLYPPLEIYAEKKRNSKSLPPSVFMFPGTYARGHACTNTLPLREYGKLGTATKKGGLKEGGPFPPRFSPVPVSSSITICYVHQFLCIRDRSFLDMYHCVVSSAGPYAARGFPFPPWISFPPFSLESCVFGRTCYSFRGRMYVLSSYALLHAEIAKAAGSRAV